MSIRKMLEEAGRLFMERRYQEALDIFLAILRKDPENLEAQMGAMLCDLVSEDEEEAAALYDFFLVLKEEGEPEPYKRIIAMIQTLDVAQNSLNELQIEQSPIAAEGISYADFKRIVQERGSFKRAFEDIMFSTKVIITKKSDFFDFIDNLIESGFTDMVYSYIEDATKLYPTDKRLSELLDRLQSTKA